MSRSVTLGPLTAADKPALFEWINDRSTVQWNAPYRPVHAASHDGWFESLQEREDLVIFAIRRADDGRLIGTCQLHSIDRVHRNAELQIRIASEAERGRGFGADALALLIAFGFEDLNLERIYLHVFEDNERAIAAYLRAGFVAEGVARRAAFVGGSWRNITLMGLLRGEWRSEAAD
jgi:RimJ/RimL family protein N-acetyltransferase